MLSLAAFNVDKRKFGRGALLVFVVSPDDEECGLESAPLSYGRTKDFKFKLMMGVEKSRVGRLVGTSLGFLSTVCLLAVIVNAFCNSHARNKKIQARVEKVHVSMGELEMAGRDVTDGNGGEEDAEENGVTSIRDVLDR